jgi:hypothetical protein
MYRNSIYSRSWEEIKFTDTGTSRNYGKGMVPYLLKAHLILHYVRRYHRTVGTKPAPALGYSL